MKKQFQGSKKKARRAAYLERQEERKKRATLRLNPEDDIETMASKLGIKLDPKIFGV